MATASRSSIVTTILQVVGSVIVALITTLGTIFGANNALTETKNNISRLSDAERIANLPIGTVVSSLLPPHLFLEEVKDPSTLVPEKSKWVLADGEKDIGVSRYGKINITAKTPDLRGMFLRGVNLARADGDAEGATRPAGKYQADTTRIPGNVVLSSSGEHVHDVAAGGNENGFGHAELGGGGDGGPLKTSPAGAHTHAISGGDIETRPKNVSVYFYIKIN